MRSLWTLKWLVCRRLMPLTNEDFHMTEHNAGFPSVYDESRDLYRTPVAAKMVERSALYQSALGICSNCIGLMFRLTQRPCFPTVEDLEESSFVSIQCSGKTFHLSAWQRKGHPLIVATSPGNTIASDYGFNLSVVIPDIDHEILMENLSGVSWAVCDDEVPRHLWATVPAFIPRMSVDLVEAVENPARSAWRA